MAMALLAGAVCTAAAQNDSILLGVSLPPADWRHALVGKWRVEFQLDSLWDGTRLLPRQAGPVTGSLAVSDRLVGPSGRGLLASLDIDFRPLLGRPMSCFPGGFPPAMTAVALGADVEIDFTQSADCGVVSVVRLAGDSVRGRWIERSVVGAVAAGTVVLSRLRSP